MKTFLKWLEINSEAFLELQTALANNEEWRTIRGASAKRYVDYVTLSLGRPDLAPDMERAYQQWQKASYPFLYPDKKRT